MSNKKPEPSMQYLLGREDGYERGYAAGLAAQRATDCKVVCLYCARGSTPQIILGEWCHRDEPYYNTLYCYADRILAASQPGADGGSAGGAAGVVGGMA